MSDGQPNLVLTGFMGTGKSPAGHFAAQMTGMTLVDTDNLITARMGMPIREVFRTLGEPEFRRIEREICNAVAGKRGQVIATGGGMLVDPLNLATMMENGVVICLWAPAEELRRRLIGDPSRPLASDWEMVFEKRQHIYEAMPHHIYTEGKRPEQVAEEAVAIWRNHSG
jgi:shikimate kinase